jgi:hypothetical protein
MAKRPGYHKVEVWIKDEDFDWLTGWAAGLGSNVSDEIRVAIYSKFPILYRRAEERAQQTLERELELRKVRAWNAGSGGDNH